VQVHRRGQVTRSSWPVAAA